MKSIKKIILFLDSLSQWMANICCWLVIPLMLVLFIEVVARKFFVKPTTWGMDMSYMINGTLSMAGAIYALRQGAHICTDFISQRWPIRIQGAVNLILYLFLFFPGISIFLWFGWNFAYISWLERERAITSAWMPPIYPLKMIMAIGIALLILQGISEFLKNLYIFFRGTRP